MKKAGLTAGNMWLDAWRHVTLLSEDLLVILNILFGLHSCDQKLRNVLHAL